MYRPGDFDVKENLRKEKGQGWLGQSRGHMYHGGPCHHLRKGWYSLDAASLRFEKKPVKTGKVDHRRGLAVIVIRTLPRTRLPRSRPRLIGYLHHCMFLSFWKWCCMQIVAVVILLALWSYCSPAADAAAQALPLRQSDGTTVTISPLGDDHAIYSDAHGNKGPTHFGSGLPSQQFSTPHGVATGTVTPFGTPTPPNLLTPAPLLPLQPKGMAIPQPQAPALPHSSGPTVPSGIRPGR